MSAVIRHIEEVRRFASCTGCGVCAGCCPTQALKMLLDPLEQVYYPVVTPGQCNSCGLCLRVCPEISKAQAGDNGAYVPLPEFPNLLQANQLQGDPILGMVRGCYLGHASDEDLRFRATSGGICSTILIDALETATVDGAIVVRMGREDPLRPEIFIATTAAEVEEAAQSKYCPVPLGIILKEVLSFDGKLALVGLPCHLRALRKAAQVMPGLEKRITLWVGLFCLHSASLTGTMAVLKRLKVKAHDVEHLRYRGHGWPGGFEVVTRHGARYQMGHNLLWGALLGPFFSPIGCTLCYEATGELSDISLGDAWSARLVKPTGAGKDVGNPGESLIIARTERGQNIIGQLQQRHLIQIQEIDSADLLSSQKLACILKKQSRAGSSVLRWYGRILNVRAPERTNVTPLPPNIFAYVRALLTYLDICLLRFPAFARLWELIPLRLLRMYGDLYWLVGAISVKLHFGRLVKKKSFLD